MPILFGEVSAHLQYLRHYPTILYDSLLQRHLQKYISAVMGHAFTASTNSHIIIVINARTAPSTTVFMILAQWI